MPGRAARPCSCPGVVPGETVRARIAQSRRDFDRAELLEVLTPSPDRVVPACPLAGICGGCDWLHIAHARQNELKRDILAEAMRRVGRLEPGAIDVEPGPPLHYRNRAQVHRDSEGRLGYMAARSETVVPVRACPVAVAPIDAFFAAATGPASLDRFTLFSDGTGLAVEGIDDDRTLAVNVLGTRIEFSVGCFFQSNLAVLDALAAVGAGRALGGHGGRPVLRGGAVRRAPGGRFRPHHRRRISTLSISFARRNIRAPRRSFFR